MLSSRIDNGRPEFGAAAHPDRKAFTMRQPSKSLIIGSACALALERQHEAQTQALAQRHTVEQKALQVTHEPKSAGKHEEPHG
jgi:hypothetical protein